MIAMVGALVHDRWPPDVGRSQPPPSRVFKAGGHVDGARRSRMANYNSECSSIRSYTPFENYRASPGQICRPPPGAACRHPLPASSQGRLMASPQPRLKSALPASHRACRGASGKRLRELQAQ